MNNKKYRNLYQNTDYLIAYVKGELSEDEESQISLRISQDPILASIVRGICKNLELYKGEKPFKEYINERKIIVRNRLFQKIEEEKVYKFYLGNLFIKRAASILIIVAASIAFFISYYTYKNELIKEDRLAKSFSSKEVIDFEQEGSLNLIGNINISGGSWNGATYKDADYYKFDVADPSIFIANRDSISSNFDLSYRINILANNTCIADFVMSEVMDIRAGGSDLPRTTSKKLKNNLRYDSPVRMKGVEKLPSLPISSIEFTNKNLDVDLVDSITANLAINKESIDLSNSSFQDNSLKTSIAIYITKNEKTSYGLDFYLENKLAFGLLDDFNVLASSSFQGKFEEMYKNQSFLVAPSIPLNELTDARFILYANLKKVKDDNYSHKEKKLDLVADVEVLDGNTGEVLFSRIYQLKNNKRIKILGSLSSSNNSLNKRKSREGSVSRRAIKEAIDREIIPEIVSFLKTNSKYKRDQRIKKKSYKKVMKKRKLKWKKETG